MLKNVESHIKKAYIIVLFVIAFLTWSAPAIRSVIKIGDNEDNIVNLDVRVSALEQVRKENHDLLLELKFNLRKHMETAGEHYIDLGDK